ncbi:hypothetical protein M3P36_05630 [Altererythrobacter sp. KTW20L]|uniref:hypothetical protein n=1 Tax=Altererythrobacter sp. KTW20L TaxID=2942210 RepID=UPI0020C12218|nr:hypothetical protein [Altererythrobacter sp. KTW20L]MCL6250525.1 hypothetical protein [Altererythrobacter sp. KTW20L]
MSRPAAEVPGVTDNPATNLLLADIVMRTGSYLLRRVVQRGFLKQRYGKDTAREIVHNRSLGRTLVSVAVARLATNSIPGAMLVGTGIAAKLLYERGKSRHQATREGDAELLEMSED